MFKFTGHLTLTDPANTTPEHNLECAQGKWKCCEELAIESVSYRIQHRIN